MVTARDLDTYLATLAAHLNPRHRDRILASRIGREILTSYALADLDLTSCTGLPLARVLAVVDRVLDTLPSTLAVTEAPTSPCLASVVLEAHSVLTRDTMPDAPISHPWYGTPSAYWRGSHRVSPDAERAATHVFAHVAHSRR